MISTNGAAYKRGKQDPCPEVRGKMMNCNSFGTYEPPLSGSKYKTLCHGGIFENERYDPCPVKVECFNKTQRSGQSYYSGTSAGSSAQPAREPERRSLPVVQGNKDDRGPIPLSAYGLQPLRRPDYRNMPTRFTQEPTQNGRPTEAYSTKDYVVPAVVPPKSAPESLQKPHLNYFGEMAPTFIPETGEDVWVRLMWNVVQSVIAAVGWQIYAFARTINLFG